MEEVKKIVIFALVVAFIATTAFVGVGCKTTTTETTAAVTTAAETTAAETTAAANATKFVAVDLLTMADEFFTALADNVKKNFGAAGIKTQIASADMDEATQWNQIENFVTMGATDIFLFAVNPKTLNNLKKYNTPEINIFPIGVLPTDPEAYDACLNADQASVGVPCAKLAAEWIEKTFPDAPAGSIEVGAIINTGNSGGMLIPRGDAMMDLAKYTDKAKIAGVYDVGTDPNPGAKAQELVDAMMIEHPKIKVILAVQQASGLAANEAIMRMKNIDLKNFGVFSCDFDKTMGAIIADSATNKSVLRCGVSFGDVSLTMLDLVLGKLKLDDKKQTFIPAYGVSIDNLADFYTAEK
jgi:ABC-type sugar transport system substrate-binding protein